MAQPLKELFTRLGFDVDETGAKKYQQALTGVVTAAKAVVATVTAGVVAVTGFTTAMALNGNEMAKVARTAGVSAEELDKFTFAVERLTLLGKGEAQGAMIAFNESLRGAAFGGRDYVTSFRRLGFSIEEIRSKSVTAADVLDRLQKISKDGRREAEAYHVANQIFGAGLSTQLIPALRETNESFSDQIALADALGKSWSQIGGEDSERFVDAFHNITRVVKDVSIQIAERLIPIGADLLQSFSDFLVANRDLIDSGIDKFFELLGVGLRGLTTFFGNTVESVGDFIQRMGGVQRIVNLLIVGLTILTAIGVVQFFTSAAKAARLFGTALWALARNPVLLPLTALVLVLEDLVTWVTGGNSVLGKMVGEFADLKPGIKDTVAELQTFIDKAKELAGLGIVTLGVAFELNLPRIDGAIDRLQQRFAQMIDDLATYISDTIDAILRDITDRIPSLPSIGIGDLDLGLIDRINALFPQSQPSPAGASPSRVTVDQTGEVIRRDFAPSRAATGSVGMDLNAKFDLNVTTDDASFVGRLQETLDSWGRSIMAKREEAIRQMAQEFQAVDQ